MSSIPLILSIPEVALEKILSFLTFDEIAKYRMVCSKFNETGGKLLTRGFLQIEKRHNSIYKKMKSLLPRRESERRSHPLARHCDILSAVETRLSMLTMTYMKYMENNVCCFIPGKVIDEIQRILTLVESVNPPPRTHELLQELRDISSMAMEHFDDIILPRFKTKASDRSEQGSPSTSKPPKLFVVQQVITEEIQKIKKQTKMNKQQLTFVIDLLKSLNVNFKKQNRMLRDKSIKIKMQDRKLHEQETRIEEQQCKIQAQEASIADLKKHMDEWDQKFSDLSAELVRAREDLNSKQVSSPPITTTPFKSNIKPRTALPKFYEIPHLEFERKRKAMGYSDIPMKMQRSGSFKNISDDIRNKINESITNNISNNITEGLLKEVEEKERSDILHKRGLRPFLSSSIETILKAPISGIKSRKRKNTEDIDLE